MKKWKIWALSLIPIALIVPTVAFWGISVDNSKGLHYVGFYEQDGKLQRFQHESKYDLQNVEKLDADETDGEDPEESTEINNVYGDYVRLSLAIRTYGLLDENGDPVYVLDEDGDPVLDENGKKQQVTIEVKLYTWNDNSNLKKELLEGENKDKWPENWPHEKPESGTVLDIDGKFVNSFKF